MADACLLNAVVTLGQNDGAEVGESDGTFVVILMNAAPSQKRHLVVKADHGSGFISYGFIRLRVLFYFNNFIYEECTFIN